MDKVAKGMSASGTHPNECCHHGQNQKGMTERAKEFTKEIAHKIRAFVSSSGPRARPLGR